MKILSLLAATAALMITASAQDAKVAPVPSLPTPQTERALSETEVLRLQLTIANIQLLQEKYKIPEYQKEIQPEIDKQEKIAIDACASIGIPADKAKTECGLTTGIGQDGKPIIGPDGKPVQAKVWWNKPAPPPVVEPKK